jgi:hypothetical protein
MSTIQEIVDKVINDTRQTQRATLVTDRVRSALRHTHGLAYFKRDYISVELENDSATDAAIGTITLPTGWRALTVVRPMASGKFIPNVEMVKVSTEMIAGLEKVEEASHTYHTYGNVLEYQVDIACKDFKLGYYAFPNLVALDTSTWISEQYPDVIAVLAEARVRQTLGDREAARNLINEYQILVQDIVNENETGVVEA